MERSALREPGDAGYRCPLRVTCSRLYDDSLFGPTRYALCPRCGEALERDFVCFCCHCGQALDWRGYPGR